MGEVTANGRKGIGVLEGSKSGICSLRSRLHVKIQGGSLFDGMLRQREMRGY